MRASLPNQATIRFLPHFFTCASPSSHSWPQSRTKLGHLGWVYRIGVHEEFLANPIYVYGLALQFATAIFTTNSAPGYAETQLEVRATRTRPRQRSV